MGSDEHVVTLVIWFGAGARLCVLQTEERHPVRAVRASLKKRRSRKSSIVSIHFCHLRRLDIFFLGLFNFDAHFRWDLGISALLFQSPYFQKSKKKHVGPIRFIYNYVLRLGFRLYIRTFSGSVPHKKKSWATGTKAAWQKNSKSVLTPSAAWRPWR